jgi:hypothetical protein
VLGRGVDVVVELAVAVPSRGSPDAFFGRLDDAVLGKKL